MSILYIYINRQTSGESASLPQYLGCNTVFDMRLHVTLVYMYLLIICIDTEWGPRFVTLVLGRGGIYIYIYIYIYHSSQLRLIPYLHHRTSIFSYFLGYTTRDILPELALNYVQHTIQTIGTHNTIKTLYLKYKENIILDNKTCTNKCTIVSIVFLQYGQL
jgi:hypothetical protein